MEGKKISFGFKKVKKNEKPVVEEQKDYIECVEEKAIKVLGGELIKEVAPLVIPMKANTLVTAERLKQIAEEVEKGIEDNNEVQVKQEPVEVQENETLEQMAARELMQDAKKEIKVENEVLTVPIPSKAAIEGQKESTLDDYESVPIQEFGMAMLRGMGWAPGKEQAKYKQPQLRPKGLGLGADKVVKDNQKKKTSNDNEEELSIVKNSFVKITTGKHSGYYGRVVSLDEDNGRVMVEITVKKETVSLSEFMMQPVKKAEYDRESKVLNADMYEEFKKNEKPSKTNSPKESEGTGSREGKKVEKDLRKDNQREERSKVEYSTKESNGRSKERSRRRDSSGEERSGRKHREDSSDSDGRSRRRSRKRYSSNDSLSSDFDKPKKHKKHKKRYGSDSDSEKDKRKSVKRDIDKKRKGKKKKRDRDRSPNYKKYRK